MENRNLILALALSVAILLGWNFLQKIVAPPAPQSPVTATTAPDATLSPLPQTRTSNDGLPRVVALTQMERVRIETPRLSGSLSLTGARIDDLVFLDYRETVDPDSPHIVLFSPAKTSKSYHAAFGWWTATPADAPGPETVWTADRTVLSPGAPVTLSWTNPQGVLFQLVYAVDDAYLFTVTQRVINQGAAPLDAAAYGQIARTGDPKTKKFYLLHEGLIGVLDGTLQEISYEDLEKEPTVTANSTGGWLGITDKYWLAALAPAPGTSMRATFRALPSGADHIYATDALTAAATVAPGATLERTLFLFTGPKQTGLLDRYSKDPGIDRFDLGVDFGWLYFLTKPIFYAIHWLNGKIGNFGLSILALTVLIKLTLFPLANKSYTAMSRMKLLQPRITELRERCGEDRQKFSQEMMALYKREKVNPMSGCLPIVIQIPIFFALYKVLFVTIEMRHALFFGWIHDLSAPDPIGLLTAFGLFDWTPPHALAMLNIGIWPILMGITMWLQQRLNPAPTDPIQAKVFAFLPIIFTVMLATFPAGLVIYWTWNNLLSIAQQWVIMKRVNAAAQSRP